MVCCILIHLTKSSIAALGLDASAL
jgi:hypothetical protein